MAKTYYNEDGYAVDYEGCNKYYPKYVKCYNTAVGYIQKYCGEKCPRDPLCSKELSNIFAYFIENEPSSSMTGMATTWTLMKKSGGIRAYTADEYLAYFCTEIAGEPYSNCPGCPFNLMQYLMWDLQIKLGGDVSSRCKFNYTFTNLSLDSFSLDALTNQQVFPGTYLKVLADVECDALATANATVEVTFDGLVVNQMSVAMPTTGTKSFSFNFKVQDNATIGEHELEVNLI